MRSWEQREVISQRSLTKGIPSHMCLHSVAVSLLLGVHFVRTLPDGGDRK